MEELPTQAHRSGCRCEGSVDRTRGTLKVERSPLKVGDHLMSERSNESEIVITRISHHLPLRLHDVFRELCERMMIDDGGTGTALVDMFAETEPCSTSEMMHLRELAHHWLLAIHNQRIDMRALDDVLGDTPF